MAAHVALPTPRLITVKEAADLLGCSPAAVRKWLYQRRLTPVKVGRLTRLRLGDIEAVAAYGLPEASRLISTTPPMGKRTQPMCPVPAAVA